MKMFYIFPHVSAACDEYQIVRGCVFHVTRALVQLFPQPNRSTRPDHQVVTGAATNQISCTVSHE